MDIDKYIELTNVNKLKYLQEKIAIKLRKHLLLLQYLPNDIILKITSNLYHVDQLNFIIAISFDKVYLKKMYDILPVWNYSKTMNSVLSVLHNISHSVYFSNFLNENCCTCYIFDNWSPFGKKNKSPLCTFNISLDYPHFIHNIDWKQLDRCVCQTLKNNCKQIHISAYCAADYNPHSVILRRNKMCYKIFKQPLLSTVIFCDT